jgi:DHA2 family methylenomycin A resistance protein-like MFS transporter
MNVALGRRFVSDRATGAAGGRALAVPVACLGFFMVVLDTTVVNVALPSIGRSLGGGISGLQWAIDGYTVVFAALVLSAGHISDRIGASVAFGRGIALFGLSSAACGLAPTLGVLLGARVLQGAAAAMMLPASLALVGQAHTDPRLRAQAIAIWAAAGGAAVAAGPVVGGVLTETLGWRTVFFINLPIAAVALALLPLVPRSPRQAAKFDVPGQLFAILALASLTFGVIEGAHVGFGKPQIVAALSLFVVASAVFAFTERRAADPAVPLGLLANRRAVGTLIAGLALYFSFYGVIFVLSLFFQNVLHHGPATSGLLFLPMTALITLATVRTGAWIHRSGAWVPMTVGFVLMSAGSLALLAIDGQTTWWEIGLYTIPVGVGAGIAGPAIPVALLAAIPAERSGVASGIANALRQTAATLGVAVYGALLAGHVAFVSGMHRGFAVSAGGTVIAVLLTLAWIRPRAAQRAAA